MPTAHRRFSRPNPTKTPGLAIVLLRKVIPIGGISHWKIEGSGFLDRGNSKK
jgi:hypothetical protein